MGVHRRPGEVTAVVCAGFDPGLDAAVLGLVTALREAGLRVSAPRHPPHFTLGAVTVPQESWDEVRELVAGSAARVAPFAVRLDRLAVFGGGTLWLGPQPCAQLTGLQARVDAELRGAGHSRAFGAVSDPDHWVAHCTLARRLTPQALGAATARLADRRQPLSGRVERLLMIRLGQPGEAEPIALTGPGRAAAR